MVKHFKQIAQFLLVFGFLALPVFILYKAPQPQKITMKIPVKQRELASLGAPAMKTCEMEKRIRWKCMSKDRCYRDGFENVRVCKSLK